MIEKRMNTRLSFFEWTQLEAHLILCKWCKVYEKKADFLQSALRNVIKNNQSKKNIHQIDNKQLKEDIFKKLKK